MDPGTATAIAAAPVQLVRAAVSLKKLYDAFFDEHRNASSEAREFAQLVSTFAINLVNQERLIGRAGKFFPGEENFLKTIDQCTEYLEKYDSLLRVKAQPVRKAYEVTKWQADLSGERKRLIDNLNIHVNSMNSYSMNVLLEIALRDREAIRPLSNTPAQEVTAAEDDQTLHEFSKLYNSLYDSIVVLQNRQKRDKRYERMPDLVMTDLKGIIDQWRTILIQSGMREDRLPELPVRSEQETFESSVTRWRRDIYREQSLHSRSSSVGSLSSSRGPDTPTSRRDSTSSLPPDPFFPRGTPHPESGFHHSPIDNAGLSSPEPIPGTSAAHGRSPSAASVSSHAPSPIFDASLSPTPTWNTAFTGESLMSQRQNSRAGSIVDEMRRLSVTSSQPIAEVEWKGVNKHQVPLYAYEIDDARRPRTVTFNKGTSYQIDHVLSKSLHPFTKHSSLKRPLELSFLEEQEIKYHKKSYKPSSPIYTFTDETELKKFQSTIHGRQLLETFEVEKISTSTSGRHGEAAFQHAKIWKSNTADRHYLCYYANALASQQQHRTLSVSWFDRPSLGDKPAKHIKLTLSKPSQNKSPQQGPPRRPSVLSISSRRRSSTSTPVSPATTEARQSALMDNDDPLCPDDIQKLGFVEIHFASSDERQDFVAAFVKAMDGTLLADKSPTIPEEEFPAEAARTLTFQEMRATPSSLLNLSHLHPRASTTG